MVIEDLKFYEKNAKKHNKLRAFIASSRKKRQRRAGEL